MMGPPPVACCPELRAIRGVDSDHGAPVRARHTVDCAVGYSIESECPSHIVLPEQLSPRCLGDVDLVSGFDIGDAIRPKERFIGSLLGCGKDGESARNG